MLSSGIDFSFVYHESRSDPGSAGTLITIPVECAELALTFRTGDLANKPIQSLDPLDRLDKVGFTDVGGWNH